MRIVLILIISMGFAESFRGMRSPRSNQLNMLYRPNADFFCNDDKRGKGKMNRYRNFSLHMSHSSNSIAASQLVIDLNNVKLFCSFITCFIVCLL